MRVRLALACCPLLPRLPNTPSTCPMPVSLSHVPSTPPSAQIRHSPWRPHPSVCHVLVVAGRAAWRQTKLPRRRGATASLVAPSLSAAPSAACWAHPQQPPPLLLRPLLWPRRAHRPRPRASAGAPWRLQRRRPAASGTSDRGRGHYYGSPVGGTYGWGKSEYDDAAAVPSCGMQLPG